MWYNGMLATSQDTCLCVLVVLDSDSDLDLVDIINSIKSLLARQDQYRELSGQKSCGRRCVSWQWSGLTVLHALLNLGLLCIRPHIRLQLALRRAADQHHLLRTSARTETDRLTSTSSTGNYRCILLCFFSVHTRYTRVSSSSLSSSSSSFYSFSSSEQ